MQHSICMKKHMRHSIHFRHFALHVQCGLALTITWSEVRHTLHALYISQCMHTSRDNRRYVFHLLDCMANLKPTLGEHRPDREQYAVCNEQHTVSNEQHSDNSRRGVLTTAMSLVYGGAALRAVSSLALSCRLTTFKGNVSPGIKTTPVPAILYTADQL